MLSESVASAVVLALSVYLLIGVIVAVAFLALGAGRIDPAAAQGTLGFRILVFPGCVALWPLVLMRWRHGGPPRERNAHRDAARPREDAA
ncbi:MAG: hypothetical protein AAFU65_03115 [Pseudomonadota bacterium]